MPRDIPGPFRPVAPIALTAAQLDHIERLADIATPGGRRAIPHNFRPATESVLLNDDEDGLIEGDTAEIELAAALAPDVVKQLVTLACSALLQTAEIARLERLLAHLDAKADFQSVDTWACQEVAEAAERHTNRVRAAASAALATATGDAR